MELDEALCYARANMVMFDYQEKYEPDNYEAVENLNLTLHVLYNYVMKAEKEKKLNSALKGGKDGK